MKYVVGFPPIVFSEDGSELEQRQALNRAIGELREKYDTNTLFDATVQVVDIEDEA